MFEVPKTQVDVTFFLFQSAVSFPVVLGVMTLQEVAQLTPFLAVAKAVSASPTDETGHSLQTQLSICVVSVSGPCGSDTSVQSLI